MTRRVVLLGRVSRGEKDQDPESQLRPLRSRAQQLGWTVVKELSLKLSGWDDKKAGDVLAQVMEPIERGEADTIAVWALDRLNRQGAAATLVFLKRLEEHHGAQLYSLQEPFLSTASADPATRELLVPIIAWVAKWESKRKSQRVLAKVETKRNRAEAIGQTATWGKGNLASREQVNRIHELAASGRSVRQISTEMAVSKSQVSRILRDRRPDGIPVSEAL